MKPVGFSGWIPTESSVVCHCCSLLWGRKTHKAVSDLKIHEFCSFNLKCDVNTWEYLAGTWPVIWNDNSMSCSFWCSFLSFFQNLIVCFALAEKEVWVQWRGTRNTKLLKIKYLNTFVNYFCFILGGIQWISSLSVWNRMAGCEKHKFLEISLIPYSHFVC